MLITDERFFTEELDTSFPGLEGIDVTYRENGLAAAEKQLADCVRSTVRAKEYLSMFGKPKLDDVFMREIDNIMKGNLSSTGFRYQFPDGKVDWEANPTYNGYCEWTWQLSRHPEWVRLAQAYEATGDEKYAEKYVYYLTSWCEQALCPEKASGYATKCWRTIEAGIRLTTNWNRAFLAFYKSPAFTDHVMATYMKSVWEHGYRLSGFWTTHNWVIMEMSGLSQIGMLYPYLKKSAEWKKFALEKLEKELDVQIYPDGFQYELTTGYQGVHIGNYKYVMESAKVLGEKVPDGIRSGYKRLFGMYMKLCGPDWRTPELNDGSRAGVPGTCAIGYSYFADPELQWFATKGKEGKAPDYTSVALPYSGMAAMRTGWGPKDVYMFMDAGPFGYAHQHEDKLNVIMYAYGKDVLPDAGTYAYDTSEMRKFILDTRSHNCAMVDDRSQNRRGRYKYGADGISTLSDMKWGFAENYDTVEGIYDEGYGPEYVDVTHKRKLVFFKSGLGGSKPFAAVIDRFISGDGKEHKYAVSYQTNDFPYNVKDKTYTATCGDGVTFSIIGSLQPEIIVAQKEPYWMGWVAVHAPGGEEPEHLHVPCLRYTETGTEKRIVTVLYPSDDGVNAVESVVASSDVADTGITFRILGSDITVDENDYPCLGNEYFKL